MGIKWFSILSAALGLMLLAQDGDFENERKAMVSSQLIARGIENPAVLHAMSVVPRHRFVPNEYTHMAYKDRPLPIGHRQTISQPYIVAYMTEQLELQGDEKVLEIGTGSGYQAAVLAQIVPEVYTIEIIEDLASSAASVLKELKYDNVKVRYGDGYAGWEEHAPYDAIIVTAAVEVVPLPLLEQLAEGGRLILPEGDQGDTQFLRLIRKVNGQLTSQRLLPVRFVPFTREQR